MTAFSLVSPKTLVNKSSHRYRFLDRRVFATRARCNSGRYCSVEYTRTRNDISGIVEFEREQHEIRTSSASKRYAGIAPRSECTKSWTGFLREGHDLRVDRQNARHRQGRRMVGWISQQCSAGARFALSPGGEPLRRYLSGGWHFGHPDIMKGLLLEEGIPFKDEYQVDLDRCLWLPWEMIHHPRRNGRSRPRPRISR